MLKKQLIILSVILTITGYAAGIVSTNVYLSDSKTPLEIADVNAPFVYYKDIMAGTKLTIAIDSNSSGLWEGGLYIAGIDRDYGVLTGRDFNDITLDWKGSRLGAAGSEARIYDYQDDLMSGFDFYGDIYATAGQWYIIDYTAINEGTCSVGFYDYLVDYLNPVYYMVFNNVPTRDFNDDSIVNFQDFAVFASAWQVDDCTDSGKCAKIDLNKDNKVDINDLILFADYWLESTQVTTAEPNSTDM
jgi:hypothetical protein